MIYYLFIYSLSSNTVLVWLEIFASMKKVLMRCQHSCLFGSLLSQVARDGTITLCLTLSRERIDDPEIVADAFICLVCATFSMIIDCDVSLVWCGLRLMPWQWVKWPWMQSQRLWFLHSYTILIFNYKIFRHEHTSASPIFYEMCRLNIQIRLKWLRPALLSLPTCASTKMLLKLLLKPISFLRFSITARTLISAWIFVKVLQTFGVHGEEISLLVTGLKAIENTAFASAQVIIN